MDTISAEHRIFYFFHALPIRGILYFKPTLFIGFDRPYIFSIDLQLQTWITSFALIFMITKNLLVHKKASLERQTVQTRAVR